MPKKIIYQKELIKAIEAFLEGSESSLDRAQNIIQRCYAAMGGEESVATLNDIIWHPFIVSLTDSVFYESEQYLRDAREMLLGHSSQNIVRTIFCKDYRTDFTKEEEEIYAQLLSMLDFLLKIPFTTIYAATHQEWQKKATWPSVRKELPEAIQAEQLDEEYQQRKTLIEKIWTRNPFPGDIGDEKIYHLVLREVTSVLTNLSIGRAAMAFGYPVLDGSYVDYRNPDDSVFGDLDATDSVIWAQKKLDAIVGKSDLFISWRLSKAATFGGDVLLVFLH